MMVFAIWDFLLSYEEIISSQLHDEHQIFHFAISHFVKKIVILNKNIDLTILPRKIELQLLHGVYHHFYVYLFLSFPQFVQGQNIKQVFQSISLSPAVFVIPSISPGF